MEFRLTRRRAILALFAAAVWPAANPAQAKTFYPMISRITPGAVAAGGTVECQVSAEHGWFAPTRVMVTGDGVTGEVVPTVAKPGERPAGPGDEIITVRFTAAAEARPGIRDVRIMTARGPSTLGQLVVVRSPLVREVEPNNTREAGQSLSLPATVCGAIEANEDVDVFRFQASADSDLTFHLHGQRLLQRLGPVAYHSDPMMTLRNAAGTIIAANDNYFGSDPFLHYRFETAGEYFLEVRDVRYAGYKHWVYTVEIDNRPFVLQTIPAVFAPGVPTPTRLVGVQLPEESGLTVTLPSDAAEGRQWISAGALFGRGMSPELPVFVARDLAMVAETAGDNETFHGSQPITCPVGITGTIDRPEDVDGYAFEARQGDRLTFSVVARAAGSPLDSYLRIIDEKGQVLAENDDFSDKTGNADCRNEITDPDSRIPGWKAPADGRYVVEIRDTHLRGGDRFTYFLEARPSRPGFRLELDNDKSVLAPGVSTPLFVRAFRTEGFEGPIGLAVEGLPPGVTATCGRIPADGQDACIFLNAPDDAIPGGCSNLRVIGEGFVGGDETRKLTATAQAFEELRRDGGARYMTPVETHTVGVADALDLKHVRNSESVLALRPGETRSVKIAFERAPGFKEPVTLTAIHSQHVWVFGRCLPPSITVDDRASTLRIAGDDVEGTIVLKVAPDAKPAEPRLVPLMANVAINFSLKMMYCGEPVLLSIENPARAGSGG